MYPATGRYVWRNAISPAHRFVIGSFRGHHGGKNIGACGERSPSGFVFSGILSAPETDESDIQKVGFENLIEINRQCCGLLPERNIKPCQKEPPQRGYKTSALCCRLCKSAKHLDPKPDRLPEFEIT